MSGHGPASSRIADGKVDGRVIPDRMKVAIIAARWHPDVMDGLLSGARSVCDAARLNPTEVRVPGTFELSVTASVLAARRYEAIIALGVVIRGGTPHFDYVCQAATNGLSEVAVRTGVPIGFGVITCDNDEQARDRAGLSGSHGNKGEDAAEAAISTAMSLAHLHE